jgi:hypothetical protein
MAKKKVTKEKGLPRQSKPKVCSATGIFRLANPWLGRKTTRIPARRPPGLQSASAVRAGLKGESQSADAAGFQNTDPAN